MNPTIVINNEECHVIEGYERYHISESGRVYRTSALNNKEQTFLEEGNAYIKELSAYQKKRQGKMEQPSCALTSNDGIFKNQPIAPIVLKAFGNLPKHFTGIKYHIDFIDGNFSNLHISNLKISDKKGNNSKLSRTDTRAIKKLIAEGITLKEISKQYGVSDMQINRIKTGENWGNGKRKILAPEAPFPIENPKIRRFIALFNREEIDSKIRKPFYIKRNPDVATDNMIVGILKGYKLSHSHVNITRARVLVDMLNDYFFTQKKEEKEEPQFNEFYKSFE